jgi:hypothetical protein
MGAVKEWMIHHDYQLAVATDIAVEAGVLSRCEFHEDIVLDNLEDPSGAYKLGNYKFSKGVLRDVFETRTQMTDAIKEAIQDAGPFGCGICAKMLED